VWIDLAGIFEFITDRKKKKEAGKLLWPGIPSGGKSTMSDGVPAKGEPHP